MNPISHSKEVEISNQTSQWDVFIAYSSPDKDVAHEVAKCLTTYLRVFIDTEVVKLGDQWDIVIRDALAESSVVMVLISPTSDRAFYQREELLRAIERMRRDPGSCVVIPVFVGGITPSDPRVPYGLKSLQGIILADISHPDLAQKIVERVSELSPHRIETTKLSRGIASAFEKINQEVLSLTAEQYRVIKQLRHLSRVRISGCAGSGKTLVAAEKCARLAASGQKTLFLCHNPLLAEKVSMMLSDSGALVLDFCAWIDADAESNKDSSILQWTHFEEPTAAQLQRFMDNLQSSGNLFDAVVVDEAQDFRDEWWEIVEAALSHQSNATLYIFHDNNQSLLPRRGRYPIDQPQIDLSRNCRNAGKIYELMRYFDNSSPEPELKLSELGEVTLTTFTSGQERLALASLIREHAPFRIPHGLSVLWSGQELTADAPIAEQEVAIAVCSPWQDEVRWQFQNATKFLSQNGLSPPPGGHPSIAVRLMGLSKELYPTSEDILLVQDTAAACGLTSDIYNRITKTKPYNFGFHWVVINNRITLKRRASGSWWGGEVIIHFRQAGWHETLPKPTIVRVVPYMKPQMSNTIPLYSVSEYKGLESDTVILIMRGRTSSHRNAVYVGVSRARGVLAIAADSAAASVFPHSYRWDRVDSAT